MKRYLHLTLITSILLSLSCTVRAQSTCAQILRTARATYDQGKLHELPGLLEGCLKSGFSKQEKVEAYKLLTLAYIYLEEPAKADEAMLQLLRTDSYFEINESADPAEFIALYKTFRTSPVYRIGARLGVNATKPSVVSSVYAIDGSSSSYKPGISFQVGATLEIPINKKLTLNPELNFQVKSFKFTSTLALDNNQSNSSEGKESHSWVSIPVILQYKINESKFNPYVGLGVAGDYLLNAKIVMARNRVNATSIQERTYDISEVRNSINISAVAAGGIKLKLGSGYVISELRIIYGITSINNANSAFAISDYLLFDNGYADSIIRLNSVTFTAGYIYNVFNPKKIKRKK